MSDEPEQKEPEKSLEVRLQQLLINMERHLGTEAKGSVSDYMRLLQFQRQLADDKRPREIKVTWSETLDQYDTDE